MAKKKRNLKPDIILKNYWRDNERFADLFNAVLFGGEQVIQPDELEDLDAERSTVLEHRKYLEILLDGSRPAGEIRSRAIGYTKERQVDKAVIMTAAGAVDNKIDYNALEQKGDVDMHTVFEETRIEGRVEGRAEEIIETGYEFGLSDDDILGRLQRKLDISLEMARAYLRKFGKQTV